MRTHALVLAGGEGRRLGTLTVDIPKPLVPVAGVPMLDILLRQLAHEGFGHVTIAVRYLADLIEEYCGNGQRWGLLIDYIREPQPLGTAGSLAWLQTDADRMLVINGDVLTDVSFMEVAMNHDLEDAVTAMACRRSISSDFGVLEAADDGLLVSYTEKPTTSWLVSCGISIVSTWALPQSKEPVDMPDFLLGLIDGGQNVRIREVDGYWRDLGRVDDLRLAEQDVLRQPSRFLR